MSVEAMAIALHHSRAKGTAKLILLGIANHSGDGGAWPAMATLAKYGACNVRNAQQAVKRLEELNEVKRHIAAGGNHSTADHMRPNLYQFMLTCPVTCDGSTRHRIRGSQAFEMELIDPLSPATPPVASDIPPLSPATPEPSFNHPTTTIIDSSHVLKRAQGDDAPAIASDESDKAPAIATHQVRCPKRTHSPHAYSKTGVCIDCGSIGW